MTRRDRRSRTSPPASTRTPTRPPYLYNRPVTDREYVQRVRQHPPSALVPLIAAAAARYWTSQSWIHDHHRKFTPWALADAARVSVVSGNEHRSRIPSDRDLLEILAAYMAFTDKALNSLLEDPDTIWQLMLRMSGEQLTWQEHEFHDFARTVALLTQTTPIRPPRVMRPGWDIELLGCPLSDYVGIAQLLLASAIKNAGRFDPASLDGADAALICQVIPKSVIMQATDAHFSTDIAGFRVEERAHRHSRDPEMRRFEHNPLRSQPFLTGFGPGYLTPAPRAIIGKVSPLGLYHTGVQYFGNSFAQDFGELLEQYVGRQLKLLTDATVIPEITYKFGRDERRSVDWIAVFDELVVLVEVKSRRPTQDLRLASESRVTELKRLLEYAYTQIDTTANLIMKHHPAFASIPDDRAFLGLIITQEPFHIANAPFQRKYMPAASVPIAVAGISELEGLVTVTDMEIGRLLREWAADEERSTWALETALTGREHATNAVLDAAWATCPWARAADNMPGSTTTTTRE
jgi:hypothetical protein